MIQVEFTTIPWDETMFKNTYETAWQVVLVLVSYQKTLAIFRKIASQPEFSQVGDTVPCCLGVVILFHILVNCLGVD